jgi:hypothetical protein
MYSSYICLVYSFSLKNVISASIILVEIIMNVPQFSSRYFSACSDLKRKPTDIGHVSTICSYMIKMIILEINPLACLRQFLK